MILIANIALLGWPLVALWLFSKYSLDRAIILSVLISSLFLPAAFAIDLPGAPPLDKVSLPGLMLLLLVIMKAPKESRFRIWPKNLICRMLLIALVAGTVGTALSNQDTFAVGGTLLRGTSLYDAVSEVLRAVLIIAPFLVGWQYLSSDKHHEEILKLLVSFGAVYSLMMLAEVRLSPQIHVWVYGFFPHNFGQQMRDGGFRPVVFLGHGLIVAFFAMTITVAAAALWRHTNSAKLNGSQKYLLLTLYFGFVLILCKSLGSLIFGVFLVPLICLLNPKKQITVAAVLALISISYPVLRGAEVVPLDSIREIALDFSQERADSLEVRLTNEERLLDHTSERPVFGWGGWGRSRVYDPITGKDVTTADGFWVFILSVYGWVGYAAYFGLLGLPILILWLSSRKHSPTELTYSTSALALLLAINMIEVLINSTIPPWTWMIGGALLGYTLNATQTQPNVDQVNHDPPKRPRTVL